MKWLTSTYKPPDVGLSCPSSRVLYPGLACCECSVAKTEHLTENKWKTYSTTQGTAQITGLPKLMPLMNSHHQGFNLLHPNISIFIPYSLFQVSSLAQ